MPWDNLPPKVAVMDIVYNPLETNLLRKAKARGCRTINGAGMLVHQGAESLRIWLGIEPPIKVMEEAVLSRLTKNECNMLYIRLPCGLYAQAQKRAPRRL